MAHPDVIIVGGGLHGCSTALQLAMRGVATLVLEKDHVGRHASGVNAGGVRQLARDFAEVPLSVASMAMWRDIETLVDDDCGLDLCGQVQVAENESELERLAARAADLRAKGYTHEEVIDRQELRGIVPVIAGHCVGGLISRGDGAAHPYRTVSAFRRKAERLGARFVEGETVQELRRDSEGWRVRTAAGSLYSSRVLVNCAGAWAGVIGAGIGEPVPLAPIAPMLMITQAMPRFLDTVVIGAGRTLSFKQFANGTVLIGGGHRGRPQLDDNTTDLDFAKLSQSARTVLDLFPLMKNAIVARGWAGIEALMPDQLPVIGKSATSDQTYHAFGFSAHGFQLGPIVGRILAELIAEGRSDFDLSRFSPGRFAS